MSRSARDLELDAEAAAILRGNDRGGYTVPTHGLYPFQWNWDSCLVALGWARLDEARAWQEIETLFAHQWPDGMVPHIVFHRPDPGYFPGPERWGTGRTPPTSGITQPPVAASCVRRLVEQARDAAAAEARARALLPDLLAWHRWFHTVRDPDGTGLVAILHPWESGMDNSPAWDEALARVEIAPDLEPYVRRDTQHVDPSMRPTRAEYDRFMTLVQRFRAQGWRHEIVQGSPFRIADVGVNCILHRADRDLRVLAERVHNDAAVGEIDAWLERSRAGMVRLVDPTTGLRRSRDLVTDSLVPAESQAGFLAFWAGLGDERLAAAVERWIDTTRFAVPSVAADDPRFDGRRYWRGPVWAVVNFMIGEGLRESGRPDLGGRVRADTAELIRMNGFYEYFDPRDGQGLGGSAFTWTAAMWLAWAGRAQA